MEQIEWKYTQRETPLDDQSTLNLAYVEEKIPVKKIPKWYNKAHKLESERWRYSSSFPSRQKSRKMKYYYKRSKRQM